MYAALILSSRLSHMFLFLCVLKGDVCMNLKLALCGCCILADVLWWSESWGVSAMTQQSLRDATGNDGPSLGARKRVAYCFYRTRWEKAADAKLGSLPPAVHPRALERATLASGVSTANTFCQHSLAWPSTTSSLVTVQRGYHWPPTVLQTQTEQTVRGRGKS